MIVEYRVKPVTRYIVTRYEAADDRSETDGGKVVSRGEYDSHDVAYEVGYALCRAEHERLGYALDDRRIQYPKSQLLDQQTQVQPMKGQIGGPYIGG